MNSFLQPYIDSVLAERSWSWSLIGILYVLAALFVRSWFIGPLFSKARLLDHSLYSAIKHAYAKRSFWGWLLFFLPLALFVLFWQNYLPQKITQTFVVSAGSSSLVLSIMFHLQAFGAGAVSVFKKHNDQAKEKSLY